MYQRSCCDNGNQDEIVEVKATPFSKKNPPRGAVLRGTPLTHASQNTRNELWPKKAQRPFE